MTRWPRDQAGGASGSSVFRVSSSTGLSASSCSSVVSSPTRDVNIVRIGPQYGGIVESSVTRFDGPTISTPHANLSGVIVTPASKSALDKSLVAMLSNPTIKVAITAHPDGTDKDAADLAAKRAEAVKWYLVEQGVAQAQLVTRIGAPVKATATVIELAVAP